MRRPLGFLVATTLLTAACSGAAETTTTTSTTSTPTTAATTTMAAPTTTAAPATTPAPTPREGPEGTPLAALTSFRGETAVEVEIGEVTFSIEAEGIRVGSSFECTLTAAIGGLEFAQAAAGNAETFWLDIGGGYREVPASDLDLLGLLELCPVTDSFWMAIEFERPDPSLVGTPEDLNGIPTARYDFAEAIGAVGTLGLVPELEGIDVDEITIWIAEDGEWFAGFVMDATVSAEVAAESFELPVEISEGDDSRIAVSFFVSDPDDSSLAVDLPS